jgi:glycosyltransferase involved in cell wall biosynthesis
VAEAVCRILQDRSLAEAMGQCGLRTAAHYSWRSIAGQILDFYVKTGLRTLPEYSRTVPAASTVV